ncbi:MAG: NAD(P)/FAD-dependent oxidoreductase [Chloroflexota bacterium]|nr:NAD(P)/FAD-dependent oxidoreductase [Chloroflexota bacterium]
MTPRQATVVGSGPNGLAAAITLARAGRSVLLLEAQPSFGGGLHSAELTLPGYVHDVCAAILPLAIASPFFRELELPGVAMVHAPAPLAHPFDDGTAAVLERSVARTAATLGRDVTAYRRLMGPLVADGARVLDDLLGPLRWPSHPLRYARLGMASVLPAALLARLAFRDVRARGLLAGLAAHSLLPLERPISAGFGLVLGLLGHLVGWPMVRGGSQRLADALVEHLRSLGGEARAGARVGSVAEIMPTTALLDLTPRQVLSIASPRLPPRYRRLLSRYRYGLAVFKVDWALDGPIPWAAAACRRAATVHLGGTLEEVAASERAAWEGRHAEAPFVLVAQQTLFDATRAPSGRHTAWAYCHVPHGSRVDMTAAIEAQLERFAPGFRRRILARSVLDSARLEQGNANLVGGDINGGVQDLWQLWTRPTARLVPYSTPDQRLFVCSSSTPPGGGVHGMCGVHAARAALRRLR